MSGRLHASLQWTLSLAVLALGAAPLVRAAGQDKASAPNAQSAVVMLTSQQDHDRQMQLLKISGFPPGPDAYQAATYNEATATPYPTLPDPLVMNDGTKVTTPAQWTKRRAEIKELFDREVYGRVPQNMPAVKWEVVSSEKGLPMGGGFGGAAPQPISDIPVITKQLVGHVDNSSYPAITVNIGLTLVTPANATGPVPIVMQFGGGGPNPMPANNTPNPCAPPPGFAGAWRRRRTCGCGRAGAAAADPRTGGAELAGAVAPERLGLRDAEYGEHSGRQRVRSDRRHHRPDEQGPAAEDGRLGLAARARLGRGSRDGLLRDRQGRRRQTRRRRRAFALGQGDARDDGLRRALCDRLRELVG